MVFDKVFKKALKGYYLETRYTPKKWLQLKLEGFCGCLNTEPFKGVIK